MTSMQRSSELRHARTKARGGESKGIDALLERREEYEDRRRRTNVPHVCYTFIYAKPDDVTLEDARALRVAGKTEKYIPVKPKETKVETFYEKAQRLINEWGLK